VLLTTSPRSGHGWRSYGESGCRPNAKRRWAFQKRLAIHGTGLPTMSRLKSQKMGSFGCDAREQARRNHEGERVAAPSPATRSWRGVRARKLTSHSSRPIGSGYGCEIHRVSRARTSLCNGLRYAIGNVSCPQPITDRPTLPVLFSTSPQPFHKVIQLSVKNPEAVEQGGGAAGLK